MLRLEIGACRRLVYLQLLSLQVVQILDVLHPVDGVVGAGVHELRVSQTPFLKDCGDAAHSFGASWKPLELKAGGIHTRSFVFFDSPLGNVSGLGEFKRELEGGAHTFLRLKTDFAVEFPDDLLGYEKAQTDPLGVNLL